MPLFSFFKPLYPLKKLCGPHLIPWPVVSKPWYHQARFRQAFLCRKKKILFFWKKKILFFWKEKILFFWKEEILFFWKKKILKKIFYFWKKKFLFSWRKKFLSSWQKKILFISWKKRFYSGKLRLSWGKPEFYERKARDKTSLWGSPSLHPARSLETLLTPISIGGARNNYSGRLWFY